MFYKGRAVSFNSFSYRVEWGDFFRQKIVWASVGETYYSLVDSETFVLDTNYFFAIDEPYFLIGVLNSKLIKFWINSEDTQIGDGGAYRHYKYNLERLCVPQTITTEIETLVKHNLQNQSTIIENKIDNKVYALYQLTQAEIDYIEDRAN